MKREAQIRTAGVWYCTEQDFTEMWAEIDRLRRALEYIIRTSNSISSIDIAREALEQK